MMVHRMGFDAPEGVFQQYETFTVGDTYKKQFVKACFQRAVFLYVQTLLCKVAEWHEECVCKADGRAHQCGHSEQQFSTYDNYRESYIAFSELDLNDFVCNGLAFIVLSIFGSVPLST